MYVDPRLPKIRDCLYRVAVKAIIVNDGKFLLVKELDDKDWSFPGGGIDYGESAVQALIRELHEEIGVEARHITTNGNIVFSTAGQAPEGIPRLNLFFEVTVPINEIKIGVDAEKFDWYSVAQLKDFTFSKATGDVMPQLLQLAAEHKI